MQQKIITKQDLYQHNFFILLWLTAKTYLNSTRKVKSIKRYVRLSVKNSLQKENQETNGNQKKNRKIPLYGWAHRTHGWANKRVSAFRDSGKFCHVWLLANKVPENVPTFPTSHLPGISLSEKRNCKTRHKVGNMPWFALISALMRPR